ncbi:nitrous oxide reductase family maturation protein NosD [uncultured Flavonifractor sp.]|nr:nitrous oxide reductase family maturation protein NosD [uncultured Flavonifractor sp.]
MLVVGNDVLPNGAETTAAEMQEFCSAQAEAGTPVLVSYALAQPVYEVLHQDVQLLLNTLSVPGGVCSVWFEGGVLPSGADIGLPRGDYPNAGLEGAYRLLAELSNPLPVPAQDDLYTWALAQQRGGVFSTNGAVTTKNVPESGNLTGILSVTEQGTDVSMIAFGPTGKIHTATRIAGVWRGWVQVYSDLAPPPLMGGAAAAQAGSAGLAPAPAAGAQGKYLRGDGTWADVPESRPARYVVGTSAAGWTANDCDYLCDGTSDQTEINAAIAALPSGGGEVLVLDGTYNISSSIKINKDNVTIRGSGPATVLKRMFNSASANGVINCSAANCTIHHLAIDGNKGSYTNENNRGVYATTSAANFTIEDLVVQNSRDGIYIGGMTGGRITGCRIKDSGAYGVYVYNAEAIDISHNYIDATGETAVLITGSKSIKVDGDTITGSVNYGIRLIGSTTMCTLANNVCLDNAGGISLESASMCNVSDNLCMRGSGTPEDYDSTKITIRATSASSNNIIAGNLVMGKNVEDSGTGNLVINNKFE